LRALVFTTEHFVRTLRWACPDRAMDRPNLRRSDTPKRRRKELASGRCSTRGAEPVTGIAVLPRGSFPGAAGTPFVLWISHFVSPPRLSSFGRSLPAVAGNSYFSPPSPLLGLTYNVKFSTLCNIKARWACLPRCDEESQPSNTLRGRVAAWQTPFAQCSHLAPRDGAPSRASVTNYRRTARSLKTRTRPFGIPETPPSAPWPAGYPCAPAA
jgi:hypothetical protein